jgi:hypothetical protein
VNGKILRQKQIVFTCQLGDCVIAQDITSVTTLYVLFLSMRKTDGHKIAAQAKYTNQSRPLGSKHFPEHFFLYALPVYVLFTD